MRLLMTMGAAAVAWVGGSEVIFGQLSVVIELTLIAWVSGSWVGGRILSVVSEMGTVGLASRRGVDRPMVLGRKIPTRLDCGVVDSLMLGIVGWGRVGGVAWLGWAMPGALT